MARPQIAETHQESSWRWILAALAAHTAWGVYPVLVTITWYLGKQRRSAPGI